MLATVPREITILEALVRLRSSTPGLLGALVATVDGLPVAHDVLRGDAAGVAAMAATAAGLGKRIIGDFDFGDFAECVVRASEGYFVVYSVGSLAVLAVTASATTNLGRVHLEARRCAMTIASVLEEVETGTPQSNPTTTGGQDGQER